MVEVEQAAPPTSTSSNNMSGEIETQGLWGRRSRRDIYMAVSIVLVAVVALIVVVIVVTGDDGDSSSSSSVPTSKFVRQTEKGVLLTEPQAELDHLRVSLENYTATLPYLDTIPATVADLSASLADDATAAPELRAASWLIHTDNVLNEDINLHRRFALATIYYSTAGATAWKNTDNWLDINTHHCEWYGVICAKKGGEMGAVAAFYSPLEAVFELDFYKNNLTGELPAALVLLQGIHSLYLNDNALVGNINGDIYSNLPHLMKFYMQYNQLTGTIPTNLDANGKIDTIYVHANKLTGDWPQNYCPTCKTCTDRVHYFGIDCNEVNKPGACGELNDNCFFQNEEVDPL